jgi:hypothetical protein
MPADARKIRAIMKAAEPDLEAMIRNAPKRKTVGPVLGAKAGSAADSGMTIAQIRQMAFSPDPNDRKTLRELVAGMPPMQQNNLYLRMHAEMRSARAGVDDAGSPLGELSPEGQLIESIIWDGAEPSPEELAAIRAAGEAGDAHQPPSLAGNALRRTKTLSRTQEEADATSGSDDAGGEAAAVLVPVQPRPPARGDGWMESAAWCVILFLAGVVLANRFLPQPHQNAG